jgi:hypothetical protein
MPRSCTWMRNLEAPEVCGVRGCLPQEPLKVEVGLRKTKGRLGHRKHVTSVTAGRWAL